MTSHYTIDTTRSQQLDIQLQAFLKNGGKITKLERSQYIQEKASAKNNAVLSSRDVVSDAKVKILLKKIEHIKGWKQILADKLGFNSRRVYSILDGSCRISVKRFKDYEKAVGEMLNELN